jgi:hypothetical protein
MRIETVARRVSHEVFDDAEREAAYDREFRLSPLSEALDKAQDYGIPIVSMKRELEGRVLIGA